MLNDRSIANLRDVHPLLVKVTRQAEKYLAEKTPGLSFVVTCGQRTVQEQARLVQTGASQTMDSRHTRAPSEAVDCAVTIDGRVTWDMALYYKLADAFQAAAREFSVVLTWGAVWDRPLHTLKDKENEQRLYVQRRKKLGKRAFVDGPHFQIEPEQRIT